MSSRIERWRRLVRLQARVSRALDDALHAHGLTANEYELLAALCASDGGYLRMRRLADGVGLPQSTTSRVVAKLERDGLLERYLCPDDRRGVFTRVTPAGRARFDEASGVYAATLDACFDPAELCWPERAGEAG